MHGHLEFREVVLQALDNGHVTPVRNLVLSVRTTAEQKTAQLLGIDEVTDFFVEHGRVCRRDHRFEDLLLAMIAVEAAFGGRYRERRETVLAATLELGAFIFLERGCRKADWARYGDIAAALELGNQGRVKFGILEVLYM
jgi:hypothetical protein